MDSAAIFDLDETLFDRRGSLRLFLADQFNQLVPGLFDNTEATIEGFLKLDNRGQVPKLGVYKSVLAQAGNDDDILASRLFADYEQNACRFARPFVGMENMFSELSILGVKTGIVSNGQMHIQLRSLLALNLDRLVDVYLISETEDLRKPEPEIFLLAARQLDITPTRCIFVGDSPESDIAGACRVGMKTIWFPNGVVWPTGLSLKPDAVVQSLPQISSIVRRWISDF
ncbi:MAG: putative hydrolase of the HAD superfamily [Paracoccaceae bacterium]|jgi:putative hydrolase of the HAD superfamily